MELVIIAEICVVSDTTFRS